MQLPRSVLAALVIGVVSAGAAPIRPLINEFMAVNASTLADENSEYTDWIEILNNGTATVDLAGWSLTDDPADPAKWRFPPTSLAAGAYLVVFASDKDRTNGPVFHTNFKLSGEGEYLALVTPSGVVSDAFAPAYPAQFTDISYGRTTNAGQPLAHLLQASPGAANTDSYLGFLEPPIFSHTRGFYSNAFSLVISNWPAGATVRYTLNGSTPSDINGQVYGGPIPIAQTTVLRAGVFRPLYHPAPIATHTFLFVEDVARQSPDGEPPGPGWPTSPFDNQVLDYGMDPDVVNDSRYRDVVDDALLAIPTVSIVTDLEHLFDSVGGIYVHAQQDGREWERPTSLELLDPGGAAGFQVNAGLRIRGGISRLGNNPKHSFRLFFRSDYGPSVLKYPLFGDEGADEFDKFDLRTNQNHSWHTGGNGARNTMVRDGFCRLIQGEMGSLYTRSRFYHLFINGQYWGLYQSQERPDSAFAETYMGNRREDYDIIKVDGSVIASDGSTDAWWALWELATGALSNESYYHALGMNTAGVRVPGLPVLLQIDNLIDYMLTIYYTGDLDAPISQYTLNLLPNNFYAIHDREDPVGYRFLRHDGENTMLGIDANRVGPFENFSIRSRENFNPQTLHQTLMLHPEYRMRFADRAHKAFFNDGTMTPRRSADRFTALATTIEQAIIAESARWGDAVTLTPRTRDDDWLPEVAWLLSAYMPVRTGVVVTQLMAVGWYPTVAAPGFSTNGGVIQPGQLLSMSAPAGAIYYTTDGSDPRRPITGVPQGVVYSNALSLTRNTVVKARVLAGSWSALNEAAYFVTNPSSVRVTEIMYHPRPPEGWETNFWQRATDFEYIECRNLGNETVGLAGLRFDDGIAFDFSSGSVATLAPGESVVVVRNSTAFTNRYANWADIRIAGEYRFTPPRALSDGGETVVLRDGLGRELQRIVYHDDWYPNTDGMGFSLSAADPAATTGAQWSDASAWRPSTVVGGTPGATDGFAYPLPGSVVINELLTHQDQDDPGDWIELLNVSAQTLDLTDWYLSDDPATPAKFRIPAGAVLALGGTIVFTEHAHFGVEAAGAVNGFALSELGETVVLASGTNGVLTGYYARQDFGPIDRNITLGRHVTSDGHTDFTALAAPTRGSSNAAPRIGPIVINEILYAPAPSSGVEFIELLNISAAPVPLYLPAAPAQAWRFDEGVQMIFPTGLVLAAGAHLLVTDVSPAVLRAAYPALPPDLLVLGPYAGALDNGGEWLNLVRPGEPDPGGPVPTIVAERLRYDDVAPWPVIGGTGASLERVRPFRYANDSASWQLAPPGGTPGFSPGAAPPWPSVNDYDGDGLTDIAAVHAAPGNWYIRQSRDGAMFSGGPVSWTAWTIPVPGDYDGDALCDLAAYQPADGKWHILSSRDGGYLFGGPIVWGPGSVPVPADYDGDGKADLAVYAPSDGKWYIRGSLSGRMLPGYPITWGPGSVPVPADYDGDGKADLAVYAPGDGKWYIRGSATGKMLPGYPFAWGPGALPVPADYDGDRRADLAVYQPSDGKWYIRKSSNGRILDGGAITWGAPVAMPVLGDHDGDGRTDIGVYASPNGKWYIRRSSDGQLLGGGATAQDGIMWGHRVITPADSPYQALRSLGMVP